jgi:hypothetical protein
MNKTNFLACWALLTLCGDLLAADTDRLKEFDSRISQLQSRVSQAEAKKSDLTRQMKALEHEKVMSLIELTMGEFCSECKRTKSEIEKSGLNFEDHLREVKGKPVAAPLGMRNEREAAYDQKISNIKGQRSAVQKKVEEWREAEKNTRRAKGEVADTLRRKQDDDERLRREAAEADWINRLADKKQKEDEGQRQRDHDRQTDKKQSQDKRPQADRDQAAKVWQLNDEIAQREARANAIRAFKNTDLPKQQAEIRAINQQGSKDASLSQVGGALKVTSGAGKVANEFGPAAEKELMRKLRDEVDQSNKREREDEAKQQGKKLPDDRPPVKIPGTVGRVVDGAAESYLGAKQMYEDAQDKRRIDQRQQGTDQMFQAISTRLERRINSEEDLLKALREELKQATGKQPGSQPPVVLTKP